LISATINLIFFGGLKLAIRGTDDSHLPEWLLTFVPLIPLLVLLHTVAGYWYYVWDIKKGEKWVFKEQCKRKVINFDADRRNYLWIENFKEIEMEGYNYDNYDNYTKYFPEDEIDKYEIHLAPKSEVILYLKKL
jgi:hypothetical protein